MSKTSFKVDEIAEMQSVCKKILVGKLLDHVRQHGKAATTDLTDCTDKPKAIDLAEQLRQALLARLAA